MVAAPDDYWAVWDMHPLTSRWRDAIDDLCGRLAAELKTPILFVGRQARPTLSWASTIGHLICSQKLNRTSRSPGTQRERDPSERSLPGSRHRRSVATTGSAGQATPDTIPAPSTPLSRTSGRSEPQPLYPRRS